jgi:hypothetical protein
MVTTTRRKAPFEKILLRWKPGPRQRRPNSVWQRKAYTFPTLTREKVGLGNAYGDPGDGCKGYNNFLAGNRNFYCAGLRALTKEQARAQKLMIGDRAELEAGLDTYARDGKPKLKPLGSGYFPVVNPKIGYYISGTSLAADGDASIYSADHYLDSSVVPGLQDAPFLDSGEAGFTIAWREVRR